MTEYEVSFEYESGLAAPAVEHIIKTSLDVEDVSVEEKND